MSKIFLGPTGYIAKGHVLDCSKSGVEGALKSYDKQLYVEWNPTKLKGWGCWEVRRKPEQLSKIVQGEFNGCPLYSMEYVELDIVNHVVDAAFLNYDVVRHIKSIDAWGKGNFVDRVEDAEKARKETIKAQAAKEMRYAAKHDKKIIHDFMGMLASGVNPAELANHWNTGSKRL